MHPAYFETHFRIGAQEIDWPIEFAIITAYATTGETWTAEQNLAADLTLERELRLANKWVIRITGYSPTTGHGEPGWAVALPVQAACEIGLRYKQDAIYYVMNDSLYVTHCRPEAMELVLVGEFRSRLTSK